MSITILYILQSATSVAIFYLVYLLLFKSEAYYVFSRYYLLFAIFISLFLPLLNFSIPNILYAAGGSNIIISPVYSLFEYSLSEVVIYATASETQTPAIATVFSFFNIAMFIYFAGVIFSLMRFVFRFYHIATLIKKSKIHSKNGMIFIYTKFGTPVFSFFNYIFIDEKQLSNIAEIEKIITHEKIHIKQKHSIDLIIAEILIIIQWFNPLAYLLRKSIKENHEFIADNNVIIQYPDILAYTTLLIQNSSIVKSNILTHNFSYSLLKRRLFMIKKSKSPFRFSIKLVAALVTLNLVLFACSEPVKDNEVDTPTKTNEIAFDTVDSNTQVFNVVEKMPEFPGGMSAFSSYLGANIKYPETAKANGVEGKVYINFVVEKDGSIDSVKVLRGIGSGCDEEAVRVIKAMPNWNPGMQKNKAVRVSYNVPIKFSLGNNTTDTIYTVVEKMPEFPGGFKKLMVYLGDNINYPEAAKKAGIYGRVFVSFVVEKDGRINEVKVLRGIGSGCDQEAIRVVKSMPNWKPGLFDGKPVRVQYNLPIKYALN